MPPVHQLAHRTGISLQLILLMLVAVTAVPMFLFAVTMVDRFAASERERLNAQIVESAKGAAQAADSVFASITSSLRTLSTSPFIRDGDAMQRRERLLATFAGTGRVIEASDVIGNVTASPLDTPGPTRGGLTADEWAAAVASNGPWISDVLQGVGPNDLSARVVLPVRDAEGNIRVVLHAIVTPSDFNSLMETPGVPSNWIVSICDSKGVRFRRTLRNDAYAGKALSPGLMDFLAAGKSGVIENVSAEQIQMISTLEHAPQSRWIASIGIPSELILEPLRQQRNYLQAVGLILVGLVLALGLGISEYIKRSMRRLNQTASRVGEGEIVPEASFGVTEMQELGAVLTKISHDLSDRTQSVARLNATLEQKVASRTAELSAANARLLAEIKKREDSETQLRQMQKLEAIGELTGGIAHDFNNMLAIITSSLNLIRRRIAKGGDVVPLIDSAQQGAERAAALTARLLSFARQQNLSPIPVDSNALIADMEQMLRRTLPENISIVLRRTSALGSIYTDPSALENAIINLAANARDAMPDGGSLTIATEKLTLSLADIADLVGGPDSAHAGEYVAITVKDSGKGMPPEIAAQAFKPFFTTKPIGHGTGLGLSQVYGFVTQSRGYLRIVTEDGKGTAISLLLPCMADVEPVTSPTEKAKDVPGGSGEVILVVEDEPIVRALAVDLLEELNYTPVAAHDPFDALEILDSRADVAVLLTDVMMPGMNGADLAVEVHRRRPQVKVLFATGYAPEEILGGRLSHASTQLITKPFTLEQLALKLRSVLQETPSAK